jgi:hypothetical protein
LLVTEEVAKAYFERLLTGSAPGVFVDRAYLHYRFLLEPGGFDTPEELEKWAKALCVRLRYAMDTSVHVEVEDE